MERGRKYHFGAQGMRYWAGHKQPYGRGQQAWTVLVLPLNPGVQLTLLLNVFIPSACPPLAVGKTRLEVLWQKWVIK